MTKDEALKLALEALELTQNYVKEEDDWATEETVNIAITVIKEALAQPEQCLDCGSNNLGVPANYDSVIDSVKLDHIAGVGKMVVEPKKGLFIDLIARHEGLAEELAEMDLEPVAWIYTSKWNPLTDDGDALRLAVKLNLLVPECIEDWEWCRDKTEHTEVCANYRRAIVRAAAELGSQS